MSKLIEGKRRYTNGYMIYGCDNCGQGFKMYLEESLENGGPSHKPVPFTIECPFCGIGQEMCHSVRSKCRGSASRHTCQRSLTLKAMTVANPSMSIWPSQSSRKLNQIK